MIHAKTEHLYPKNRQSPDKPDPIDQYIT